MENLMGGYVYGSGINYLDYIQAKSLLDNVTYTIKKGREESNKQLSIDIHKNTKEIIASNEALARDNIYAIEESTKQIVEKLDSGFSELSYKFDIAINEISELNARFHWGFGKVIAELGHMNDSIEELVKIAKSPVENIAYNHFQIARDAFRKKLYIECVEELQKAISGDHVSSGYNLEWRFHQLLGTIQLGFFDCDNSLIDLTAAENSFIKAARYAMTDYPEDAGRALLSAGWSAYCQGKLVEALSHTEKAAIIYPKLGEAYFQIAKIKMAPGESGFGLTEFEKAIDIDRFYILKAAGDGDFKKHENELIDYINSIRKNKYKRIKNTVNNFLEKNGLLVNYSIESNNNKTLKIINKFLFDGESWPLYDMLYVVQNLNFVNDIKVYPLLINFQYNKEISREENYIDKEYVEEEIVVKPAGFFRKEVRKSIIKEIEVVKSRIVKSIYENINVPYEFIFIPAGSFSREGNNGVKNQVTISNEFYIGKFPVTQELWKAVMGVNPSRLIEKLGIEFNNKRPVENVSWVDCQNFIGKLKQIKYFSRLRLPTQAEWEYACRAGSNSKYYFGNDTDLFGEYGWHINSSLDSRSERELLKECGNITRPVCLKKPNSLGLYDMLGNVWEWCEDGPDTDSYIEIKLLQGIDPRGKCKNDHYFLCGGSANCYCDNMVSDYVTIGWKNDKREWPGLRLLLPSDFIEE